MQILQIHPPLSPYDLCNKQKQIILEDVMMLKYFDYYTEDETADKLIKGFVNEKIIEHIECATDLIPADEGFLVPDDFVEMVSDWFPKSGVISDELKIPIMLDLYQKLDCKEEHELTTIEKFIICKILKEAHDVEMDIFMDGFAIDPLPDVMYLYEVIKAEGIAREAECKPAEILLIWRNLAAAIDFIFEDTDFLFLDLITKDMVEDLMDLI